MRRVISVLGVVALMLAGGSASAQDRSCDFLTAGGDITTPSGAKGNFGVGGSCKPGGDEHGLWGHLEYVDHGFVTPDAKKLNVHWLTITGYFVCADPSCSDAGPDIQSAQPTGTRLICGTARTNLPQPDDTVDWAVAATDRREPGKNNDIFMIQMMSRNGSFAYATEPQPLVGGNVQLHKPNKSTGLFNGGPTSDNCPAFMPPPSQCTTNEECSPADCNTTTGTCCPTDLPAFRNGVCVIPD